MALGGGVAEVEVVGVGVVVVVVVVVDSWGLALFNEDLRSGCTMKRGPQETLGRTIAGVGQEDRSTPRRAPSGVTVSRENIKE